MHFDKSKLSMKPYDHQRIEKKWQRQWAADKIYQTKERSQKPKFYCLDMFPYPSGEGLHVGHPRGYIATDIISRYQRMKGKNVLHPMGWDAFGLPAENYALKNKVHPSQAVKKNVKNYKRQLSMLGFDYDWSREINTTDPEYYKWTQWIFLQLYKAGLAYESYEPINWCPSCQTGLANEDLEDGRCERCNSEIEKKPMRQWVLKITDYAERLLNDLDGLDWPESIKEAQRNWIGKSEGAEIDFPLTGEKRHYVLLHGYKSSPEKNFFPWLAEELKRQGHTVEVPTLPDPDEPDVHTQRDHVLESCHFDEKTVLLGHSLGSVVALKVLEELDRPIEKLILVAGFSEPNFKDKKRSFEEKFDWQFDFEKIKSSVREVSILRDEKDTAVPAERAETLKKHLAGEIFDFKAEKPHVIGSVEPMVLEACRDKIKVFTTRPDTLGGVTYMVLAPEHQLLKNKRADIENWSEVEKYILEAQKRSEIERVAEGRVKTGVRLKGLKAVNPFSGEELPVFVADFVLSHYGTGAIMSVPAHDQRDLEFARKYQLPIKPVILKPEEFSRSYVMGVEKEELEKLGVEITRESKDGEYEVFIPKNRLVDYQKMIRTKIKPGYWNEFSTDRGFYFIFKHKNGQIEEQLLTDESNGRIDQLTKDLNGQGSEIDPRNIYSWLAENEFYRDLLIHEEPGVLVNSGDLSGLGSEEAKKQIIARFGNKLVTYKLRDWVFSRQRYWGEPIPVIHCRECGVVPVPEKDLPVKLPKVKSYEPTGTGESPLANIASWVNTACPKCGRKSKRETNTMPQWAGSSWYYLRFIDPDNDRSLVKKTKAQKWLPVDMYIGGTEHATRHLIYARFWHKFLYDQGFVSTPEPFARIGKNLGLILGEDGRKMSKRWGNVINPDEVVSNYGADTLRVYEMFMGPFESEIAWSTKNMIGSRRFLEKVWRLSEKVGLKGELSPDARRVLHQSMKKVEADINSFSFNTAVSTLMSLVNVWDKEEKIPVNDYLRFLQILSPIAPHITEELWQQFKPSTSVHTSKWPEFDPDQLQAEEVNVVVQVNGRVRGQLVCDRGLDKEAVVNRVYEKEELLSWVKGKTINKIIYVPDRLINFVIK